MNENNYYEIQNQLNETEERLAGINNQLDSMNKMSSSVVIKVISGRPYYYEEWREDGKVHSKSLGAVTPGCLAERETDRLVYDQLLIEKEDAEYRLIQLQKTLETYQRLLKKRGMLENYIFEVYWKNDISARVSVRGSKVRVNRIIKHPLRQIFPNNEISRNCLNEILELRCFDKNRPDANEKLKALGLSEYRPIDIVRKTHGVSYNDYIWFRFMGENLRAEDVLVRE